MSRLLVISHDFAGERVDLANALDLSPYRLMR